MNYPSIHIEGAILSPEIFEEIEFLPGQKPFEFGFKSQTKIKTRLPAHGRMLKDFGADFRLRWNLSQTGVMPQVKLAICGSFH